MERVDPATGDPLEPVEEHTETEVDAALDRAVAVADEWAARPIGDRERRLEAVGEVLRENSREYAELMTREMGKPIDQAVSEVEKCAWVCEYYAERASEHLQDQTVGGPPGTTTKVAYEPLGPVLAVMPWNFPFWQVFRFAAPNLTAGNVGLLKHASNVPECGQVIEDAFHEAGYPEGVFQSLRIGSDRAEGLVGDDRIRGVTLTGSERAGRSIAETAGGELKKTVLELGGSDPFVVLDDADVATAAETAAWGRLQNSGQSCIAAKRFILHGDIYEEFLERFVAEMDSYTVGDPSDAETDIGPLAREDLLADLHDQVQRTHDAGASLELGGEPLDRAGFYYPPTVLTNVRAGAAAACEETFGPVAAVFRAQNERDAIALANDTSFGLGASVWTTDPQRGERVADELEAGMVFINEFVKSDPRLPFGGVKHSGYGRELGRRGIREFVNEKTIWRQDAAGTDSGA